MADIQEIIRNKYQIDLAQENILKLYKIDDINITPEVLEQKIADTRKRWQMSVNGANETAAERDRQRLEKADRFEAILRDTKLRKELFNYYNTAANGAAGGASTGFAKEYFELVATTKKINREDVDFFFKYYSSERKNKKAILEMLSKEMKVAGLGKEDKYQDPTEEKEDKKKDKGGPLIVNLFEEETILALRKALDKYDESARNSVICERYPGLKSGSLYNALNIEDIEDIGTFKAKVVELSSEAYQVRQEHGAEYLPLVDLYNELKSLGERQDVTDNYPEFKLLIKYPNLTPYMFAFVEMKPKTLKGMENIAFRDYSFLNEADFILKYYKPLYDNFGINSSAVASALRSAERKAKQNKVLEKLGASEKKPRMPFVAGVVYWLLYWPLFAMYFVFELLKAVFTGLHHLAIPVFAVLFLVENTVLPKHGIDNLLVLRKLLLKEEWLSYLDELFGGIGDSASEHLIASLLVILGYLVLYIVPPLVAAYFVTAFANDFNKSFDWGGYERSFGWIFKQLRSRIEEQYKAQRKGFFLQKLPRILMNVACVFMILALVAFVPKGFKAFSESTGYFQKSAKAEHTSEYVKSDSKVSEDTYPSETNSSVIGNEMVITAETANIRSGAGTGNGVITTASKGEVFIATGNTETASNGSVWYEIYLDMNGDQTGWASQKVIGPKQ